MAAEKKYHVGKRMIIFRKPHLTAPTAGERVAELKKYLDTLVDDLNHAMEQIEKDMKESKNGERN